MKRTFEIKSNAAYGQPGPAATIEARTPYAAAQKFFGQFATGATLGELRWEQPREDGPGLFSCWSVSAIYPSDVPAGSPCRVFISEQIGFNY